MNIWQNIAAVTEATILVVATLFPILNPLGNAAIFLNMLGGIDLKVRAALTKKIAIYSFVLLICSLLWGGKVLTFFGISIYAVQIGGGLVVAAAGWSLLGKGSSEVRSNVVRPEEILQDAFYPYTLPLTVGPGTISVAVTLGAHLPTELHASSYLSPRVLIAALVGCAIACVIVYVCYRYATAAQRLLGASGTIVVMRLSSFILMCIGVQIICTGVKTYLFSLRPF
ncbi:MAG TPA: MarC family protein [Pseudacidobacterium sp.]|jgi:multiple antibiotic resistance protein|nr:MarC family protein [Pseudacidobacterium sp.]